MSMGLIFFLRSLHSFTLPGAKAFLDHHHHHYHLHHHEHDHHRHHHDFTKTTDLPVASVSRQAMIAPPLQIHNDHHDDHDDFDDDDDHLHIHGHKVKPPAALSRLKKVVSGNQ